MSDYGCTRLMYETHTTKRLVDYSSSAHGMVTRCRTSIDSRQSHVVVRDRVHSRELV